MSLLIQLSLTFSLLSLLAVGGGTAVLPEMQTLLAHQFHVSHAQFIHIYSIGQVAPGPNMLMVLIIGLKIAGFLGAVVVLLAFFVPSSILCLYTGKIWDRFENNPWRRSIQNALEPISIGLMTSGVYAVAKASIVNPTTTIFALVSLYLTLKTKINPALVIMGSGFLFYLVSSFL